MHFQHFSTTKRPKATEKKKKINLRMFCLATTNVHTNRVTKSKGNPCLPEVAHLDVKTTGKKKITNKALFFKI